MQNIEEIIQKINELDSDFETLNSRISEYANSTKYESIDYELLNFYIETLKKYKNLSDKYKQELEKSDYEKVEYKAKKEIFIFRLEKLEKIFDVNIKKLELILSSQTHLNKNWKKDIYFDSKDEMLEINSEIYKFYKELEINYWYQKKYNINITLSNEFEEKIEKELEPKDLIKKERTYLSGLNSLFQNIELLINDYYYLLWKLREQKNIIKLFESINFINNTINKYKKSNYINQSLKISENDIYKDYLKIKRILSSENKLLNWVLWVIEFKNKYNNFLSKDSTFHLFWEENFKELLNIYYKLNNLQSKTQLKKLFKENWWTSLINKEIKLFNVANLFLDKLYQLYNKESKKFDYSNFDFLNSLLWNKDFLLWEQFIKTGLDNIITNIKIFLEKEENTTKKINYINKQIAIISKIEKNINKITNVIKQVSYTWTYKLRNSQREIESYLYELNRLLNYNDNKKTLNKLMKYLKDVIKEKYTTAKNNYYTNSNSYSWSSWESSSSWDSWWGSYSSDYSSSWSSSW